FNTVLARVKTTALEAYQHQDLPFEKLVEELNTERDLSRNPLFQVSFAMQNTPVDTVQLAGLNIQPLQREEGTTTRFDLEINVIENAGALIISCIYNTSLFRKSSIERLLGHYRQLLSAITASPNESIDRLPLLTDEEMQQILTQWNQTTRPVADNRPVHQQVEQLARDLATQTAIVSESKALDYATLNRQANQLAHYLIKAGASANEPVTVLMNRTPGLFISLLAILKAGCSYVPVDPEYPPHRLAYILADTKSRLVVTSNDLHHRIENFGGSIVNIDELTATLQHCSSTDPALPVKQDDTAYIIYTSGSTGEPKGVEVSHGALANLVAWHRREYRPGPGDRSTHLAGLGFDASVWETWPYLSAGASLHLVPEALRLSAGELWRWLVEQKITLSFMPTPLAEAVLAEFEPDNLPADGIALRVLLTGGDKLHGGLTPHVLPFRLVNHYGPTENAVVATFTDVDARDKQEPPIGRPIDNVQTFILDRHMQPVPVGVIGNLYVAGDSLAKGYLNQPELTAEKFISNPFPDIGGNRLYNTGDQARWREDGNIEFAGRSDFQIKLRGFRIEPGEIEALLKQHAGVQSALVTVYPSQTETASQRRQLVAYVVLETGARCNE
ncbi:MAG TPA: amino acid adenylation domain-containing protein, partial [Thiotrichales bacterium]|nr:amino acid adenylation domain-containing protein [Thiotrichales bacterium]